LVRAGKQRHQVALFRKLRWHDDLGVGVGVTGREQALLHGIGRVRARTHRQRGVDFHQLLVELAEFGFAGAGLLRGRGRAALRDVGGV
jgi:hypothetical protein